MKFRLYEKRKLSLSRSAKRETPIFFESGFLGWMGLKFLVVSRVGVRLLPPQQCCCRGCRTRAFSSLGCSVRQLFVTAAPFVSVDHTFAFTFTFSSAFVVAVTLTLAFAVALRWFCAAAGQAQKGGRRRGAPVTPRERPIARDTVT